MDGYDGRGDLGRAEKYLYLLLYAPGGTGRTGEPVTDGFYLQQSVFVLSRAADLPGLGFVEGDRGPFSPVLEAALARAAESGMVDAPADGGPVGLTPRGLEAAEGSRGGVPGDELGKITRTKELLNDMEYWELVSYVHSGFPGTTGGSVIREEFESRRLDAAVGLFKKGKISTGKAAEVAGLSWDGFAAELQRRGIPASVQDDGHYKKALEIIERTAGRRHHKAR